MKALSLEQSQHKLHIHHFATPTELRAESIYVKKVAFKHSPILVNEMKKATFEKFTE